jgi:hypothetical protein
MTNDELASVELFGYEIRPLSVHLMSLELLACAINRYGPSRDWPELAPKTPAHHSANL